jgi:hypothetical protein
MTSEYTPDHGQLNVHGDRVTFRVAPVQLDGWLRSIDQWIAYANSIVEE